jgi:transposase
VETDPTRTCELLVGLPAVTVLGVAGKPGSPLEVCVKTKFERVGCPTCGSFAVVKDRAEVVLVDLPSFGRPTRLVWLKRRWRCPRQGVDRPAH